MKEREKFVLRRSHIKLIKFPKNFADVRNFFFGSFSFKICRKKIQSNYIEYMGVEEDKLLIQYPFGVISYGRRIYLRQAQNKFNSLLSAWVVITYVEILYMRVLPT